LSAGEPSWKVLLQLTCTGGHPFYREERRPGKAGWIMAVRKEGGRASGGRRGWSRNRLVLGGSRIGTEMHLGRQRMTFSGRAAGNRREQPVERALSAGTDTKLRGRGGCRLEGGARVRKKKRGNIKTGVTDNDTYGERPITTTPTLRQQVPF